MASSRYAYRSTRRAPRPRRSRSSAVDSGGRRPRPRRSESGLRRMFADRREAGRELAVLLAGYGDRTDTVVFGLPRGGVPVAYEVARALKAPLDVFVVRKLGVPGHPELAMGAIASGAVRVLNEEIVRELALPMPVLDAIAAREQIELERREHRYRGDRPFPSLGGLRVILVDDGLAPGPRRGAAVTAVRRPEPAHVIVAAPVGARDSCERLRHVADEVVCARTPEPFQAVGLWYELFDQ